MNGGSRHAWWRCAAGQLCTSMRITLRIASTHGSSNVGVGRKRAQLRQTGGRGPGGGQWSSKSTGRDSVVPERERWGFVGPEVFDRTQLVRRGELRRDGHVVVEAVDVADTPDLGGEDGAVVLGDRDPLRAGGAGLALGRHLDGDRFEGRDAEVVAGQAGGPGERADRARGAEREAGDVAAHGSPDLPVAADVGAEVSVAQRLDCGVEYQVPHGVSLANGRGRAAILFAVAEIASRRRIRFGLQVGGVRSRAAFVDLARRAEQVGFDTMLIGDHVGLPDPFVVLQAAADATSSLRLGTYVLNNDFYHPALLARSAATLDVLSDGRFELGVGAGHAQPEYAAMGLSFDDAARRVARLGEAVPVLRRLLDGESVTLDGVFYRLHDVACSPRPCQARLPIVVGVGNGASVLRLAARVADGVGLTGLGPTLPDGQRHEARWSTAALERGLAIVAAGAESRAVTPALSSLVQVVAETDDREGVARGVARHVPGLEVDDALTTPFLLLGTTTEIADQVVAARERWGLSYFVTRTDSVDVMEQVIAAVRADAGSGGS